MVAFAALAGGKLADAQMVTVDSTGSVGQYSSLQLNGSGQPVISYFYSSEINLRLASCTANCNTASPTWQIVTVDSLGAVGEYTSLQLDTSGRPVVSYYDATNSDLKLATCKSACTSPNPVWQIVSVDGSAAVGQHSSLQLHADNRPVVSYYDRTNGDLKLATCTANCTGPNPTWQVVTIDSADDVGWYTSLQLNASGQPVVSYFDRTNGDLKLASCTANCAGASPVWLIVTVDSAGTAGWYTSLQLGSTGQPVISYYDHTNRVLKVATCSAGCNSASPVWQIVVADSAGTVGWFTSLQLNANNQPVVSYYSTTGGDLKLATCTARCGSASPSWEIDVLDSASDVGQHTSLQQDASGQLVLSYYDFANQDLKLARVDRLFQNSFELP
ncbi:MAG: hypothetical protein JNN30_16330 [Rhodanobacteraceae bacterium]|nr:hypothetical protein [Rhodanobacteraceae bacterium]